MADYVGQLGHVGVGKETSWGAGAAPSIFIEELSEADLGPVVGIDYPAQVMAAAAQRRVRMGLQPVHGSISFDVSAGGALPLFLLSCFGTVTTTLVNTSGGSVYQHIFTYSNTASPVERPSLAIEHNHGGLFARRYQGCRVGRVRLSLANRDTAVLAARVELVGKNETAADPAAPSFNADEALPFAGFAGSVDVNANTRFRSFDAEFASNLEEIPTAGGGSTVGRLPAGEFEVRGSASLVYEGTERRSDYLAGTPRRLRFSVAGATIASTWAYQVEVDIRKAHVSAHEGRLVPGILNESLDFRGLWDDSAGIAQVVVTNTTSGY